MSRTSDVPIKKMTKEPSDYIQPKEWVPEPDIAPMPPDIAADNISKFR